MGRIIDIGTGSYTVMTLVAAETLGLPPEQITAKLGDSDLPTAPVEGGSWGAASTGAAVQLACQAVGKKLLKAAGKIAGEPLSGAKIDDVLFEDSCMVLKDTPTVRVPFGDAMRAADLTAIEEEATAAPGFGDMWKGLHKSKNTHSGKRPVFSALPTR
jgi:xanthine dehydrogenase YagR molybdenum-binding subunit